MVNEKHGCGIIKDGKAFYDSQYVGYADTLISGFEEYDEREKKDSVDDVKNITVLIESAEKAGYIDDVICLKKRFNKMVNGIVAFDKFKYRDVE